MRYVFGQNPDQPVPVEINCWGTRLPNETYDLGTWRTSHPREQWDGRDLFGDVGGFQIRYHIESYENVPPLVNTLLDLSIPPPMHVRQPASELACLANALWIGEAEMPPLERVLASWACLQGAWEQTVIWEWTPTTDVPRSEIDGFRIYVNRFWESIPGPGPRETWALVGTTTRNMQAFPIPLPPCDTFYGYWAEAFASETPQRESPPSEPLVLSGPPCPNRALVEVTLDTIQVSNLDDGCLFFCDGENLQSYGWGFFDLSHADGTWDNQASVWFWTDHCQSGLGRGCVNDYRHVRNETLHLENEDLKMCGSCDNFAAGHNRIQLRFNDGDSLNFPFQLSDEDDREDDIWCGTTEDHGIGDDIGRDLFGNNLEHKPFTIGPFTLEQWANMDNNFSWDNSGDALSDQDADCTFTIHVRGLGRVP